MTYWCIALYVWGHVIHSGPKLCISSSWYRLYVRVNIDNTEVIKEMASIAVSYSLRIVTIGTQFYGWRVYSGCNYLITISGLRVAYIIAAGCQLRHACLGRAGRESERRISSSDTSTGYMAVQNFVEFICCYQSFGLWRFLGFLSTAVRHRHETTLRNSLFTVH